MGIHEAVEGIRNTLIERFEDRIDRSGSGGCWNWTGEVNNWGYGITAARRKKFPAHRLFYVLHVGDIPDGLVIDHTCRNRLCVNPEHLQAITQSENIALGRLRNTHCKSGHEFTPENTYVDPTKGWRQCRTCRYNHNVARKKGTLT